MKKCSLEYHVSGSDRQRLVQVIARYTQVKPQYLGAPSFAYEVDCYTVSVEGNLTFDYDVDKDDVRSLIVVLAEQGFTADTAAFEAEFPEPEPEPEPNPSVPAMEPPRASTNEKVGLTVTIPQAKVNMDNLNAILAAKGALIKKALGISELKVEQEDEVINFPWFEGGLGPDEVGAYTHLIAALCEMSLNQKRINAKEKEVDNEKYAFRCLLLRLGFIGAEYKGERKVLLRNLSGSSAFKSGQRGELTPSEEG